MDVSHGTNDDLQAARRQERCGLSRGICRGRRAGQDVRGAVQLLKGKSGKVGVTGFCMGGALTILAAVAWYGFSPLEYVNASKVLQ